jgi:hypothetical protein
VKSIGMLVLILALLPAPVGHAQEDAAGLDPVVADVVRMLGEGVSAEFVLDWLNSSDRRPGRLSPDDLIALSHAEAPPELVRRLMELSEGVAEQPKPLRLPAEPDLEALPKEPPTPAPGTKVNVVFDIDYSPQLVEYQLTPFDLIVYLNGEPLSWFDGWSGEGAKGHDQLIFERELEVGRHVIRILQERHELKSKRKGTWTHEARVFPDPILLDIDALGMWTLEIYVRESGDSFASGPKPVTYSVLRNNEVIIGDHKFGPSTRRWPPLCEEVETAFPGKKRSSAAAGKALQGCVSWNQLWEEIEDVPDRATVREQMKQSDFEPRPAGLVAAPQPRSRSRSGLRSPTRALTVRCAIAERRARRQTSARSPGSPAGRASRRAAATRPAPRRPLRG